MNCQLGGFAGKETPGESMNQKASVFRNRAQLSCVCKEEHSWLPTGDHQQDGGREGRALVGADKGASASASAAAGSVYNLFHPAILTGLGR